MDKFSTANASQYKGVLRALEEVRDPGDTRPLVEAIYPDDTYAKNVKVVFGKTIKTSEGKIVIIGAIQEYPVSAGKKHFAGSVTVSTYKGVGAKHSTGAILWDEHTHDEKIILDKLAEIQKNMKLE